MMTDHADHGDKQRRALVTGATGFVGGSLARRLHADGWAVTATGRSVTKGRLLTEEGIPFFPIDLANRAGISQLCAGQDVVFHCGALSTAWGALGDFRLANVIGTEHVIAGCRDHQVGRLIHVSTPSIYFSTESRLDVREDDPLPANAINHYAETKRQAEALVDQATAAGLSTMTVRPRAVYGPGDQSLFPRIIKGLESGRLPQIGDGENVQNLTYIDNLVDALLLCANASEAYSGRKYNVTDGVPVKIWDVIAQLAVGLGVPNPSRRLSFRFAYLLAAWLEGYHRLLRPEVEPPLTRYGVIVLSRSQTLNIDAIRADLGYQPRVMLAAGLDATVQWWQALNGLGTE